MRLICRAKMASLVIHLLIVDFSYIFAMGFFRYQIRTARQAAEDEAERLREDQHQLAVSGWEWVIDPATTAEDSGSRKRRLEQESWEEHRARGQRHLQEVGRQVLVADRWARVTKFLLALSVDQILIDAYCCLTSYVRSGRYLLLAAHRQWRINRQQMVLAEKLEFGKFFGGDLPERPAYRRHLQKLARLRSLYWAR